MTAVIGPNRRLESWQTSPAQLISDDDCTLALVVVGVRKQLTPGVILCACDLQQV